MPYDRWRIALDPLSLLQIPRLLADHPTLDAALSALTQAVATLWNPTGHETAEEVQIRWIPADHRDAAPMIGLEIPGTNDPVADADRLWRLMIWRSTQMPALDPTVPPLVLLVVYRD